MKVAGAGEWAQASSLLPGTNIAVVGGINFDAIVKVRSIPRRGETVIAIESSSGPGGKGANQAAQIARLGGRPSLIGKVGNDTFGSSALSELKDFGVDTSAVSQGSSTGMGMGWVDARGDSWIVVSPGANHELNPKDIDLAAEAIAGSNLLLMQLEVPLPAVVRAANVAYQAGVPVVLNAAPARSLPVHLLRKVDVLIVNATEASVLTGVSVAGVRDAKKAARALSLVGPKRIVLTLGSMGSVTYGADGYQHQAAIPASRTVDSTAAGDAFCGAMALGLAEGLGWERAMKLASAAGSLTVQKSGTMRSLPSRGEVDNLLLSPTKVDER